MLIGRLYFRYFSSFNVNIILQIMKNQFKPQNYLTINIQCEITQRTKQSLVFNQTEVRSYKWQLWKLLHS